MTFISSQGEECTSQQTCLKDRVPQSWEYWGRTGEMLLTLEPAYGNVQFTTTGNKDKSVTNSLWHLNTAPKMNLLKWERQRK